MKKYIYVLVILILCVIGVDSRQTEAYSVTVQKDGVYAELIPDAFINNTGAIFKKYVKKAMKYYNKYKDADAYTFISNVPDEYRDFISVARQIQDSDEIIIKNPFYIYQTGDDTVPCVYCFFAERNGKILCMFEISIDMETGKIFFWYDKMEDSHFTYDDETMDDSRFRYDEQTVGETLFYEIDEIIYAETPDKTSVVWDRGLPKGAVTEMIAGEGTADRKAVQEAMDKEFIKMSYNEKKDEILTNLKQGSNGRLIKKIEKNLKLELEDEYVEPEKDAEGSGGTGNIIKFGIYIVVGIVIMAIGVIIGENIFMKKRK